MWKFIVDVVHDFVSSLQPDVGRGFLHVSNVFLFAIILMIVKVNVRRPHYQSTLVQVMAWCRQAVTITWASIDPDICCHVESLGHYELI